MFHSFKTCFLFIFLMGQSVFGCELFAQENGVWELQKEEKGIKIYTRSAVGSPVKEVRAILQLNASLSSVVAVIRDFDNYPLWIYKCVHAKLLKSAGDSDMYYYHITDTPWPVEDRDMVSRVIITQNDKSMELRINSTGIPDYLPKREGFLRLPKSNTLWILNPIGPNLIQAEYILSVDPGGDVPVWLLNVFVTDGPFESMVLFKNRVQNPKYKKANYSFVREFGK